MSTKFNKHLRYNEDYFEDYEAQLEVAVRKDDDADLLMDGLLANPITDLLRTTHGEPPLPSFRHLTIRLYDQHNDSWPPSEEDWLYNPLKTIATFISRVHNANGDSEVTIDDQQFTMQGLQDTKQQNVQQAVTEYALAHNVTFQMQT